MIRNEAKITLLTCVDPTSGKDLIFDTAATLDTLPQQGLPDVAFDRDRNELLLYILILGINTNTPYICRLTRHLTLIARESPPLQAPVTRIGSVSAYRNYLVATLMEANSDQVKVRDPEGCWKGSSISLMNPPKDELVSIRYICTPSFGLEYVLAIAGDGENTYIDQIQDKYFEDWLKNPGPIWERLRLASSIQLPITALVTIRNNQDWSHRMYFFWVASNKANRPIKYGYIDLRRDGSIPRAAAVEIWDVNVLSIKGEGSPPSCTIDGPIARLSKGRVWVFWTQDRQPNCVSGALGEDGDLASHGTEWYRHKIVLPDDMQEMGRSYTAWNAIFVPSDFC